jgi:TonB family protein
MKLVLFVLVSVLIHLSLLLLVPNYFAVTKLRMFPIELVEPRQLYLEPFLKRTEGAEKQEERPVKKPSTDERKGREDFLTSKLKELSLGMSIDVPNPSFLVPQRKEEISPEERVKLLRSSSFFKDLGRVFQASSMPMGDHTGKVLSVGVGDMKISGKRTIEDKGTQRIIDQMILSTQSKKTTLQMRQKASTGIKGPAGRREILYRPEVPAVKVDREGEVELKFWVLPDGSVGRVFPLLRGDAELERIAINYIKQWRFNPLEESGTRVEQWGTLTVKFRLK